MNPDVSYYIGVAKKISEGYVPYVDFRLDYTPLVMYLMAIPVSIWGMSLGMVLIVQFLFLILDTFFLYLILRKCDIDYGLSVLGSVLLPLYVFMMEGIYFGLEIFVLFFGLLALLTICLSQKNWSLLLAGVLCSCAFWAKQYGLGFIGVCGIWLLLSEKNYINNIKKCLLLVIGFAAGLVVFVGILCVLGYQLSSLTSLFGEGYGSRGVEGILYCAIWLFKRFPVVILSPLVLLLVGKIQCRPMICCSIVGIVGFMFQCYFRDFLHYLILVMPFCILLTFCCLAQLNRKYLYELGILLVILSAGRMIPRVVRMDKSIYNRLDRFEQREVAKNMAEIIPVGSKNVYTHASDIAYCQFYNSYEPPCIDRYGFNATFYRIDSVSLDCVRNASYVIIDEKNRYDACFASNEVNYFLNAYYDSCVVNGVGVQSAILVYTRNYEKK